MKILGIRLKKTGKLCYLNIQDESEYKLNDNVIAETERGLELGKVVKILQDKKIETTGSIKRKATSEDLLVVKENENKAKEALEFCKNEKNKLELNMKLLAAEYTFDGSKLIIYFVSDERVDFRELVKIIAAKYKVRIELRQIGPRDEVKVYPNLGMCGKELCCRTFLQEFEPVTIKMAKEQGLQINMQKLSGSCGKLMCCLKYEEQLYKENLKVLPKVGEFVEVNGENEKGKVIGIDALNLKVKVKFGTTKEDERFETYNVNDIKWDK